MQRRDVRQCCICLRSWSTKPFLQAVLHLQILAPLPALHIGLGKEPAVDFMTYIQGLGIKFNRGLKNSEWKGGFKPWCVQAGDSKPVAFGVHYNAAHPHLKCFIQAAAIFRAWQIAGKRIHKHLPRITFPLCHLCTPFCLLMQEHSLEGIFS